MNKSTEYFYNMGNILIKEDTFGYSIKINQRLDLSTGGYIKTEEDFETIVKLFNKALEDYTKKKNSKNNSNRFKRHPLFD